MKDTIKLKRLQIQGDHFAQGAFSQVFKAKYNRETVCVKRIRPKQASEVTSIHREITLLKKSQHTNVVKLIGHCENDKSYYIVMEWIEGGTLRQYLKDYLIKLTWLDRVMIAKRIALGIQHLHDKGIIHRDIKSRNVLIERKKNIPKLCDFGFAAEITDADIANTTCGTGEWMAPELYNGAGAASVKVDTFSYGIVLVELITRKNISRDLPRSSASNYGLDIDLLKEHTPLDCPLEFFDLAISCCNYEPEMRTGWPEVIQILDSIAASLPPNQEDDSDEDFQTGIISDTNDVDEDVGDDVEDNDDYDDVQSSCSYSPSPSLPASPVIIPHLPYLPQQHVSTPQPSPSSSPSSSPSLSRPKKITALRFALTHKSSGNMSDSGSSSGGSKTNNRTSLLLPPTLPVLYHTPPHSPKTSSAPCLPVYPSQQSPSSPPLSPHSSPATSPPRSPAPTARMLRRPPPPPIIVNFAHARIPDPNIDRRSPCASALELTTPAQEVGPSPPHVSTPKSGNYAKHLLRKLAPLRFVRSRSDPCINAHAVMNQPEGEESGGEGGGGGGGGENRAEKEVPVRHDTLRLISRRRGDTLESKQRYQHTEEQKEGQKQGKEEQKEVKEEQKEVNEIQKEGNDEQKGGRKESLKGEEAPREIGGTERPGGSNEGITTTVAADILEKRVEKASVADLLSNVRENYEPADLTPLKTSSTPPKERRHKKFWKIITGK